MANEEITQTENQIGGTNYVNKNCWLARTLNYPPSKRCRYCTSKFNLCLFFQYLIISLTLVIGLIGLSYIMEGKISKLLIIAIFLLVVVYGYYFSRSTEKIIVANFSQKKAKDALENLTKNLQQKVADQTRELRKAYETEKSAKEELQSLDKIKNQFLLAVQHHLRTPLTSMRGYSDLLLGGTFGKVPEKIKVVIKKFDVSTASLIEMVNDFLDITQFQLGKGLVFPNAEINVSSILEEIIKDMKLEAESKGIYLKLEKPKDPPVIKADFVKIKAALFNLIDNAVKYTNSGGITIKIEKQKQTIKIAISDTGIGMSPESLKLLFGKTFQRGDEARKVFATGRGIGLYLSNEIIKAHNGKIWAVSDGEGKGSTFNVELPIKQ